MDRLETPADDGSSRATEPQVPAVRGKYGRSSLVTFVFADIRGFTRFTERHGSVAAARLADALVTLATEVAAGHAGHLRGSWGDQVLLEFGSPSDALRAAIALQARCVEATIRDGSTPLAVGVGLDVGEPAAEGEQQSAAALNVAARLCAKAAPAEILATAALVHLTGSLPGVTYVDRGAARLKGVSTPTRIVLVRGTDLDTAALRQFNTVIAQRARLTRNPRTWVAALVALALIAGLAAWYLRGTGDHDPVAVPPGGMAVVDAAAGRVDDAVNVGGDPEGVALVDGGLWVAQSATDAVARIDLDGQRVSQTVPVGRTPVAIAATPTDIWVVNSQASSVTRISTATNRVVQDRIPVGNQPVAIAAGFGFLWVTNLGDANVSRIDARSGQIVGRPIQVGRGPDGVAVGAGAVWVANGSDGTVSPIDPVTLHVGAPIKVGAGPKGISVTPSGVWVANRLELTVSRLDPKTGVKTDTITVGDSPFAVVGDRTSVWVSVGASGSLVRIDPERRDLADTVSLSASPYGLALVGGHVWAATRPFASARHFGGMLTLVTSEAPEAFDPAVTNLQIEAQFLSAVYDGLVGYRRAGGLDNFDPVPDLAVSLPSPTDGGKTYSFRVRTGIHYSDGRTLVPADFRRGFERMFIASRTGGNAGYFEHIVGGAACLASKGACDLSTGIVTDARTVTFHLTHPDPDFIYRLALPFGVPVPPGTVPPGSNTAPLGTGPYAVGSFTPGRLLSLVRNKNFHSWSAAARPRGYPDTIQWRDVPDDKVVAEVTAGRADLTYLNFVPVAQAEEVVLARPAQVQNDALAFTAFLWLDTSRAPFSNLDARRALSLALDRRRFVDMFGLGPDLITCTYLPPGFPGYEAYCPSTKGPQPSPVWRGPDVTEAKRLVAESGTKGATVQIYWPGGQFTPGQGHYVARLLRSLGYRARLHLLDSYPNGEPPKGARSNLGGFGLYPDYPTASSFYAPCPSTTSAGGGDEAYCDRALDAIAAHALQVGESDPGRADRLWREYYRGLADEVPFIPVRNGNRSVYLSERVGNYQFGSFAGPLLDQMWVR